VEPVNDETQAFSPSRPHRTFLSLGSNLGSREHNLEQGVQFLTEAGIQIIRASSIYSTEPVDFQDQSWFLNQIVLAATQLKPVDLLEECLRVESLLGRHRTISKGPRSLDLDILLYEDWVIRETGLTIPHPRLHLRRFVLVPLVEIEPQLVHPLLHEPVAWLLERCQDRAQVVLFKKVC
jgi:2-amino-4-hydroxy-6-hydroxymethyldihydropteridine diphosphokinase